MVTYSFTFEGTKLELVFFKIPATYKSPANEPLFPDTEVIKAVLFYKVVILVLLVTL